MEQTTIQFKEITLTQLQDKYKNTRELFNVEELKVLRHHFPKNKIQVKYGIWKQKRHNGAYLTFLIDGMPNRIRKCALDHSIEVIEKRDLTETEYVEWLQNNALQSRIITQYNYEHIQQVIWEDLKYDLKTPLKVIEAALRLGHSDTRWLELEAVKVNRDRMFYADILDKYTSYISELGLKL